MFCDGYVVSGTFSITVRTYEEHELCSGTIAVYLTRRRPVPLIFAQVCTGSLLRVAVEWGRTLNFSRDRFRQTILGVNLSSEVFNVNSESVLSILRGPFIIPR